MNTPRQPYNLAATFADQDQAQQVRTELEARLKALKFDAHISRVLVKGQMYVSFLSERPEGTIPAPVMQEVRRILSSRGGKLTTLPPEAIANIQARRAERRARGISQYESHTPTVSHYQYPAIRDAETKEILAEYPDQGELTGEEPYTGPMPGSPVYPAMLEDLPEDLRDQAARMQAEIKRKQQQKSASTIAKGTPAPGPAPASQARSKPAPGKAVKPLVERYLTYLRVAQESARARLHDKTGLTQDQYNFNLLLMSSYGDTYSRMAHKALKYRLAASAQTMIEALRPRPLLLEDMTFKITAAIADHTRPLDPDIDTPVMNVPAAPIWLELEEPFFTVSGEVAGIFFTCADREIEQMLAEEHRPAMRKVLEASARKPDQQHEWSVHFIMPDGTPATHYTYQEESRDWFITPGGEPCPTGECKEQERGDGTFYIIPCNFCGTILAYWRSWLVTALLAVSGEFAATETAEWPRRREQTTRKVKRPNSAKYDEIQVHHDYYLVSFDASVRKVRPEQPQEQEREPQERGSWVAAALEVDANSVVYVRHDFGQSQRKLDPEHNPRWKEKRTVEVRAHSKRMPMKVDSLQKRITRVIASKYKDQAPEPGKKPAPGNAANAED